MRLLVVLMLECREATLPTLMAPAERGGPMRAFFLSYLLLNVFCLFILFFYSIYGEKFADENFKVRFGFDQTHILPLLTSVMNCIVANAIYSNPCSSSTSSPVFCLWPTLAPTRTAVR